MKEPQKSPRYFCLQIFDCKSHILFQEFARTIEGFEERLYNVEANVQKEIIAIKILAENLKAGAAGSSTAVEGRLTHLEKGIDTIIDKLNSTQIGSARNNNNAR